ncbi:TPA: hypothetical protein ACH3X2_010907 [Trebouxia sp. C0005]
MGSARFFDSNNKKHFNARYLVAHIRTHEGYSSAVPPEWLEDKQPDSRDLRKLLSQEPDWCVTQCNGEGTAVTSKQQVSDFVEYAVAFISNGRWAQQTVRTVRSWTQRLA